MFSKIKIDFTLIAFLLVIIGALFLRLYNLDSIPPSLNWDEAAAGYNAWTIFHYGKDEWGNKYPLVFTSFRDDKHPVHIYLTAPFVGILGLNEFNTRLPAVLISILGIFATYFLAKKIFKNRLVGVLAAFFLAISPYHIHYSRGLWEINFALAFFICGLSLFFYGLERKYLLYLAFFSFGLSLYSYHSSKVVVPVVVLILVGMYIQSLLKLKKHFILSLGIFLLFILGLIAEPRLLGTARINQTSFDENLIKNTWVYKKTQNTKLARIEIALQNYPKYFSGDFLFYKGDQNPRGSAKVTGQFYNIDAILILLGIIALIYKRSRVSVLIFVWVLLAPLPASLSSTETNSVRSIFMLGGLNLVSAFGVYSFMGVLKTKTLKGILILVVLLIMSYEFSLYIKYYFNEYAKKEAIEWQYGMKEIVRYVNRNPQYYKVYMTPVRQQPYIFFLYYLKYPLPSFLSSVRYEESIQKSANTVLAFDRFQFGGWDTVESFPDKRVLYVVQPADYVGLRHREIFDLPILVKYPDGSDAFFGVTGR